jgi:hypothetical protein
MKNQIEFYKYETPIIRIYWNGKLQPIPGFKTLQEAIDQIKQMDHNFDLWQINIPYKGLVNAKDLIK